MTLEEILSAGFAELALPLDAEAPGRYRRYYELLTEKNRVMNLTAIEGEENSARLHFLDCAALLTLCDFGGRRVIDVGSGAGFPGLALKIARPDIELTLLDSLDKRVKFLRETADALGFDDVCFPGSSRGPFSERPPSNVTPPEAISRRAVRGPGAAGELDEAKRAIRTLGGELERAAEYTIPGTEVRHTAILIRKTADTPARYPRRWAQMKKQPL